MAFAIILLNTDLHTPNLKPEKRMKPEDFIRNLRGIDEGSDVDLELLTGVYERIRAAEFRSGSDHVTQVMKVQQTIVSKCPNLAVPYRRLVCYCRLYEVIDPTKKDRPGEAGNGACARAEFGAVWSQIVGVIGLVNIVVLRQCGGPIRRLAKGTFARSGNEMFRNLRRIHFCAACTGCSAKVNPP